MNDDSVRDLLGRLAAQDAVLATHEAELATLRAARAIRRPRGRARRRARGHLLPALALALTLALVPYGVLAVTFSDLDQAGPEFRPSIRAIADAGITIGADDPASADPNVRVYNPKGNVTREQMAVFLA